MIDKSAIIQDLKERKITQDQIAKKHNCSRATVVRCAKLFNLQIGQGIKNYWEFIQSSEALAYIIGVYLTDGNVSRDNKSKQIRAFHLNNTCFEYIQKTQEYLNYLSLKPRLTKIRYESVGHKGTKPMFGISIYSSQFAKWLYESCQKKSKIPDFLFTSPLKHKIAFLAGAIDGDGSVSKDGSIMIRGIDTWLFQIHTLIENDKIHCSPVAIDRILESGKPYYRISIKRSDFRDKGGWLAIPEKNNRLINGQSKNKYNPLERRRYPCIVCGQVITWNKNTRCETCYRNADDTLEHLRKIAPIGNKKANKIRWGHE